MAQYFTNFTEEPYGEITDLSKNWVRVGGPGTRSNLIADTAVGGGGRKLMIESGPMNGPGLVGFKPSFNYDYSNTIETLAKFSVETSVEVPGSFGIINHKYNGTQGLSVAFLPASNVKSLFLYDDKNQLTVTYTNYNWSANTQYWIRYRQENTNHFIKIWVDGTPEPAGWTMTATYDIGAVSGNTYAGLGTYTANHIVHYYRFALATNGDTAVAEYTGVGTYYNGYTNRKKLTVNSSKVGSFSGFYRALVMHTDPDLRTVANGGKVKRNPLLDIRFEDPYGVKLAHEIVEYNPTTGYVEAWVKFDTLSSSVNTDFYIYFGKDLVAETYRGIQLGYGEASRMVIERNWDAFANTENQGEASVFISGLKNPSMVAVEDPNDRPLVGQEEAGKPLVTGYIMYSVQNLNSRFGMSTGWNDHAILVYHDGTNWRYDNNSTYVVFTPVATDFLIAEASWGQPASTARAFNYVGARPAGEEKPWVVWADTVPESGDIGIVSNNMRNVMHMNGTPDAASNTFEQADVNRFAMNFGSFGNMDSADLVNGKVGKAIDFDGSNDLLRAKKDTIWAASSIGYISMWFYARDVSSNSALFSRRTGVGTGDGVNIFILGSGGLRVDFNSAQNWSTGWVPSANTWYHLVAYTDGSVRRLFINGVQVASQSSTIGWSTGGVYHHVQLGASISDATNSGNYFNGIIDEFRVNHGTADPGLFLTEYNNQNSPSTFYSIGALESAVIITDRNQSGNARISLITARDQSGITRITKVVPRDQLGNTRITRPESRLQTGRVRIQKTVSRTTTGRTRIQITSTRDQMGVLRVQREVIANQLGNLSVRNTQDRLQSGNTRVQRQTTHTQQGSALVESPYIAYFQEQPGRVSIRKDTLRTVLGRTRVQRQEQSNQTGRTRVQRIIESPIQGDVRIERTEPRDQLGNASIFKDKDKHQQGTARIELITLRTLLANTRISKSASYVQLGRTRITIETLRNITGNLRVKRQPLRDQPAAVLIAKEMLVDQVGSAYIIRVNEYTDVPRIGIRPQIGGQPNVVGGRGVTDINVVKSRTGRIAERPRTRVVNTRPRARQ